MTFTSFEEMIPAPPLSEEFITPPSSPEKNSLSSLLQWMKVSRQKYMEVSPISTSYNRTNDLHTNPFSIPSDYTWITSKDKIKNTKKKIKNP